MRYGPEKQVLEVMQLAESHDMSVTAMRLPRPVWEEMAREFGVEAGDGGSIFGVDVTLFDDRWEFDLPLPPVETRA